MGGIWPSATQEEKKIGWKLSYNFLKKIKKRMDENNNFSGSLEMIENCLLSTSHVDAEEQFTNQSCAKSLPVCRNCGSRGLAGTDICWYCGMKK